ncbi:MAG TPA: calcium-binding protein, partial [Pirellulaceae bacterium]|nr:calcium-binding protein [Pirellulaceae bacterium]
AGADELYGEEGDDTIYGGLGNDTIYAGEGDDRVWGGAGNDFIDGGPGDDEIYGEDGNDVIFGGPGNDRLHGGNGNDLLDGGPGNDSLIAGATGVSTLTGGGGNDRFLVFENDVITDVQDIDAVLLFRNTNSNWTNGQMKVIDDGLKLLHEHLGNTRLLKDSLSTAPIVFEKRNTLPVAGISRNQLNVLFDGSFERVIQFSNWDDNQAAANKVRVNYTVMGIAHNWNSTQEIGNVVTPTQFRWQDFLLQSQWTNENPNQPMFFTRSGNNQWWYANISKFANNPLSTHSPFEDWATVWEIIFDEDLKDERPILNAKIFVVNRLFTALAGFPG